jgi:magnesium-transporting ATPase (P-type)
MKPASQPTATQGGHDAVATAATVSLLTTTITPTAVQEQPRAVISAPQEPQQMPTAGIMAFVMAFFMIFLVLVAGMYVYFSLCLYLIAKKLNVSAPWTAWVPIINIWTLLQAAGKPCWWVLLFFIPLVSIIVVAYVWMCIVENLGRNKWLGLLMLVPIINLVYMGILAFSKQEHQADSHDQADVSGQEWKPAADSE